MLDLKFFKNPRFSAASFGIAAAFFALFGATFLLTQYMQFVMGFTPLEAGIRLLPFAGVILVMSPISARIVEHIGTKVTVASGLAIAGLGMILMIGLEPTSSYGDLVWRMVLWAFGQSLVMAPATESIMGSLPLAKAGVGSAVNDTTRQVGGALGVAILGSAMSSTYGSRISDFFSGIPAGAASPAQIAQAESVAEESLGGALAIAARVPGLDVVAKAAFVDGMHVGVLIAGGVALLGAIVAAIWLPAHGRDEDAASQASEYARAEGSEGDRRSTVSGADEARVEI
jgi:hypothetical protein